MKTRPLAPSPLVFFLVTFAFSWLIWIPLSISHLNAAPFIPEGTSNGVRLLGVLGPAIVAILLSTLIGGRPSLRDLFGRLAIWRVGWNWWAAAALVQPVLLLAVALAYNALGGNPPLAFGAQFTAVEFIVQVVFLAIATLGEEIGWRGVALPGLLKTRGALASSLILGLIWSTWHLPFWLLQPSFDQYGPGYLALNYLMILPMSVYITWIFQNTRASIFMSAVLHLTFNIVNVAVVQLTGLIVPFVAFIAVQWFIALLLLWRCGTARFARD